MSTPDAAGAAPATTGDSYFGHADLKKGITGMIKNGWKLAGPLTAVLVAAAVAVAGCSGSSSSAGSRATTGTGAGAGATSTGSARLAQFAQCMRAHGVTDFPDATAQGTFNLPQGMTTEPQFAPADQSCKSLAPPGSLSQQAPTTAELNKAAKFAACMRRKGEPDFPDPAPNGRFQLNGGANPVDPNAPQFKSAMNQCHPLLPPGTGFGTGG